MRKTLLLISLLFGISFWGISQSVHFLHLDAMPLLLNPALTGYSNNCYRLGINTRQQWLGKSKFENEIRKYYKTYSMFADLRFPFKGASANWPVSQDWIGIGITAYNDRVGDGNLTTNEGMISMAYHSSFKFFDFALGFATGLCDKKIDYDQLYFNSQWTGYEFDSGLNSQEGQLGITRAETIYPSAYGFLLRLPGSKLDLNWSIDMGLSFFNAFEEKQGFYEFKDSYGKKRISHLGLNLKLENTIIESKLILSSQKNVTEIIGGLNGITKSGFLGGIWLYSNSRYSVNLGYKYNHSKGEMYKKGILVDRIIAGYERNMAIGYNTYEISLLCIGNYANCKCDLNSQFNFESGRGWETRRITEWILAVKEYLKSLDKKRAVGCPRRGGMGDYWSQSKPRFIPDICVETKALLFVGDLNKNKHSLSNDSIGRIVGLNTIMGFGRGYTYWGLGVGVEKYSQFCMIPFFVDLKILFKRKGSPKGEPHYFCFMDFGYSVIPERKNKNDLTRYGGYLGNLGFGYDKPFREVDLAWYFSLSYRMQKMEIKNTIFEERSMIDRRFIELRTGFRF